MDKEIDVLVIGGSGAGVSAAISAVEQGLNVLLISKGRIGKNGNAIMAGGSFSIDGLEKIADHGFNYVRSGERIAESRRALQKFEQDILPHLALSDEPPVYNLEKLNYYAVHNLCLCLKLGLEAADLRKESRGSHIRLDYPEVNHEEYLRRAVFHRENTGHRLDFCQPEVVKFPLPKGKDENIIAYLFNEEYNYLRPKMR